MKKKRVISWLLGIPVLIITLIIIIVWNEPERDGISRGSAYKSVALSLTSAEDCKRMFGSEPSYFLEKDQKQWYTVYMDYLYRQGYLSVELTKPNAATAEGWLTYEEADALASKISERLDGYVKITKQNRTKHFPKEQWWLLYEEILKDTDPEGTVETKNLQIYATPQNVEYLTAWTAYTNDGTYGFDGLSLDAYIDREIRVRLRNHEIITVIEKASDEVQYRNVWVASAKPGELEVYWGKAKRTFVAEKSFEKPEDMIHQVADISMVNGELRKITLKKERISGKVLAVLDTSIELEGYGEIPLEENFSVYKIYGDFKVQKKSDILVGYEIQEFVVANGKLCSALTVREFQAERIRVLLMNNGFQSIFHDQVTLRLNSAATLTVGKKEIKMNSGDTLTITPNDERLRAGRMILTPEDETQGIAVESLERAQGIPYYPGRLEIKQGQDGLLLVNDLYLEDYIKRVVPSEMPGSYEKEALKAQAVCARTYAYRQIRGNTYMQYGAHVDDSTRVQVFNNIRTDEKTDIAVNETYGKLLMYQDSVLEAYYFSTSCGHTTDGTVWGTDLASVPYLSGVAAKPGGGTLDLTDNINFAEFIKNKSYPSYESEFPMYRWSTSITGTQLEQKVGDIGTITKLSMKERGTGGIGKLLEIEGTTGTKMISGQGRIRSILGNTELVITKNDGTTMTGSDTIPSAFIAIERSEPDANQVTTFFIYGGGYGHGVGMSQNGAQGMAKAGMSYQDILTFFFTGAVIQEV